MMGNIIPVMVLRPLRIMLLLMEGMGSGGEGLDVEGGDGDGGAAELVEADEDAGCGWVGGVYGVVGGGGGGGGVSGGGVVGGGGG